MRAPPRAQGYVPSRLDAAAIKRSCTPARARSRAAPCAAAALLRPSFALALSNTHPHPLTCAPRRRAAQVPSTERPKVVLVTGSAGFVGFHAARALRLEGHGVVGLDNFNSYYSVSLKRARAAALDAAGVHTAAADLNDAAAVSASAAQP
jgi:hypothetical protein